MTGDGYLIEGAAATPETVRDIRNRITHFSRGHGATEDQTGDIALAVTEATTNVARHAYPNHSEGTLDLTSRVEDRTLIVEIRDFGVGVEAQGANSGLGLGLVLMAKLTASCDVEPANPGTRVTLRFALTES
jgi:serine/threonine-protein kinase RsbW